MADLVERLMGIHATRPKIPVHQFSAIAAEWARGKVTVAQARDMLAREGADETGNSVPLNSAEEAEAQAIVNLVTSIPITGSAAAIADGRARRALKQQEIDHVLLLADVRTPPYDAPAGVRAALGI